MTADARPPMTVPERERLFELVVDWVHAVFFIVVLPVVAGVVLAGLLGWWPGFAGFAAYALYGAWTVHTRHREAADD